MSLTELHLFVPGLFHHFSEVTPAKQAKGIAPALCRCLGRGEAHRLKPAVSLESAAISVFYGKDNDAAVAKIALSGEMGYAIKEGVWLRADPVYIVADRDRLFLTGNQDLHITMEEAAALGEALQEFYKDQKWQWRVCAPHRWYLQLPQKPDLHTIPLSAAAGRYMDDIMPSGKDRQTWLALLNEIQMFLHQHPINAERAKLGLPPINSLWFWGEGSNIPAPENRWQTVMGGGALGRGFAQTAGIRWMEEDTPIQRFVQQQDGGRHFVMLDELWWEAVMRRDVNAWKNIVKKLDNDYFQPLTAMVGKKIDQLTISGKQFRIEYRKPFRHWWRFSKGLEQFLHAQDHQTSNNT